MAHAYRSAQERMEHRDLMAGVMRCDVCGAGVSVMRMWATIPDAIAAENRKSPPIVTTCDAQYCRWYAKKTATAMTAHGPHLISAVAADKALRDAARKQMRRIAR